MKKYVYIIGLCLIGLFTSCSTLDLLTYDQLHPAELTFPRDIRYVGVVNAMPYRPTPKDDILTFGLLEGEGSAAAEALAGTIADSKYFDQVVICDSALQAVDARPVASQPQLSSEQIQTLSNDLGVDMLVSLERLWVQAEQKQISYPEWDGLIPVVLAEVTPVVRIYLPNRSRPMATINFSDSLFFDIHSILSEKDVLAESATFAAAKITDKLVPHWSETNRVYYTGGCVEMRDAAVFLRDGEWEEAQNLWIGLYNRLKKGKTKSKAAFNIALSYEILNNLEEAEKWLEKSLSYVEAGSREAQVCKHYRELLGLRKKDVTGLELQMNRFNDKF